MRVIVCGGRNYADEAFVETELDRLHSNKPIKLLMHGGATGADALAAAWAERSGVKVEEFQAYWKKYGKSAGPRRNRAMIQYGEPDLVVAFPGGDGTTDMVKKARSAKIPIKDFRFTALFSLA